MSDKKKSGQPTIAVDDWGTKYRPRTLEEFVGQEGAKSQLTGMMNKGKIRRKILITGDTGHGKTTLGRIIAAMVNGIKDATLPNPDLFEYNVSSERGIDDIRNIVSRLKYMPRKNFAVHLLDEVHALTPQGASALLKPLEEPPPHVIFILATNHPDMLKEAITGRCTRITLNPSTPDDVYPLLKRVAKEESLDFGDDHKKLLRKVAEMSGGQPRLSLQFLQAVADIFAGNGDPHEAVKLAKEQIANWGDEGLAVKCLAGLYLRDVNFVLSHVNYVSEYSKFIDYLLGLNSHLVDMQTNTKNFFNTPARVKLLEVLKDKANGDGKLPSMKKILRVHEALCEVKWKAGSYKLDEKHLFIGIVGKFALGE